jgi:hypothetical protein
VLSGAILASENGRIDSSGSAEFTHGSDEGEIGSGGKFLFGEMVTVVFGSTPAEKTLATSIVRGDLKMINCDGLRRVFFRDEP